MSSPASSVPIARTSTLPGAKPSSALSQARTRANHKIAWVAHLIVYSLSCLLLWVVAGTFAAEVLAIAWGIGLAAHGFFAIVAPSLRARWIDEGMSREAAHVDWDRSRMEERNARSLEELSAAIAHEIRNPITAAKSLVQQIAEDPSGPDAREQAGVVVEELNRVERSISHLLRFAREEPFEPSSVEIETVIEAALQMMKDRAEKEGVRLVSALDEVPSIFADGEQLRKLVANLIGNAIDALVEGQTRDAQVTVSAGRNLAGTEVWISVKDNGPGIPEDVQEKIFRPFYTSKRHGTGIGLAVARKVLDRHRGTIGVTSRVGHGAEFMLTLPIAGHVERRP